MKFLFGIIAFLWSVTAFSQIKILEIEKANELDSKPAVKTYDGTVNFLDEKDWEQYVGQVFYMPKNSDIARYLKRRFYVENPKKKKVPFLVDGKFFLDAMGKYYDVEGVKNIDFYGRTCPFLLLKDREDGNVYYYGGSFFDSESGFPFVVVSYFEKKGKAMLGDTLYLEGSNIGGYYIGENKIGKQEMVPFVCTNYVLDETGNEWKELLCMEYGDVKIRIPMESALRSSKSEDEYSCYIRDRKKLELAMTRMEEDKRRKIEDVENLLSEANKLIGTTLYNYNGLSGVYKADSMNAQEGVNCFFDINTPFKVVHVGKDELNSRRVILYFTTSDGQLYLASVSFRLADSRDYINDVFSQSDIRKQHKNISERNWNYIKQRRPQLGMTMEECILAIGRAPLSSSTIETAQGFTTILNYTYSTYYFRNDKLVMKQQ